MPPLELSQAVLTQMSMRPKRCTTAWPSARTEAGSVTSTVSASACAPGVRLATRSAVSLALSAAMSATTVAAPDSASRSDVAWPMPLPPPVTTATRPSSDQSRERAVSVKSGIMTVPPSWLHAVRPAADRSSRLPFRPRAVGLDPAPLRVRLETPADALGREAELVGGVLVRAVLALRVVVGEVTDPADRLVVDRDAEVLVDAGHRTDRVGGQVVVVDIEEPVIAQPAPGGQAAVQPHLLERAPFGAEPHRVEHRAAHGAQRADEAHA